MKYLRMLVFLAVTAAVPLLGAATATATTLTAPAGTVYTGTIQTSSEGYLTMHNAVGTISCQVSGEGKVEQHGAGITASGKRSTLHITGCTNGAVHPITTAGVLEIHNLGNNRGTVTSNGARVTVTMFGFECGYSTTNTDIGELTGASTPTGHATLHVKASIPRTHGSFFCGSSGNLTGAYRITTPTGLTID
jgi:hypothetical protein